MKAPASKRRYLNQVFLLVLDDLPTWRSMNTYAVDTEAQMRLLAAAEHPAIPATSSGPAFMAIPKLSKTLVSYIVGLMVTTPYFRGSCDERAKGLAEQHGKSTLATLNTINGEQRTLQEMSPRDVSELVRHVPCRACRSPSGPRLFGRRR